MSAKSAALRQALAAGEEGYITLVRMPAQPLTAILPKPSAGFTKKTGQCGENWREMTIFLPPSAAPACFSGEIPIQ